MWRIRRLRRVLLGVGLAGLIGLVLATIIGSDIYYNSSPPTRNYFVDADEYKTLGYVINTSSCHILNISAFHPSIAPLWINLTGQVPLVQTCRKARKWTYINKRQNLVLNESAVQASGYSLDSIKCCYKSMHRVTQSMDSYDINADSEIDISIHCKPFTGLETQLPQEDEFIRVHCSSKYWPWSGDIVYRYFHAIPILREESLHRKRFVLDATSHQPNPSQLPKPNVILLGIDSMSRLSFIRNMPMTRDILTRIGAIEMMGYTKLGENTFPNAVAFMMGGSESGGSHCSFTDSSKPFDGCPFIWKDFENTGYLTAFLEDSPFLATYNYAKIGFLNSPVDFYLRPFMLGVNKLLARKTYYYLECLGSETVDEVIFHYMEDILNIGNDAKLPSFIYTWLTNLAHGDLNAAQSGDEVYAQFLQRLDLNNTILFFMSDHGYRYGPIRQTFAGWYEDKLPNFWVYLPPLIRTRYPEWDKHLLANSRRLVSPLDLHATLEHILAKYSNSYNNTLHQDVSLSFKHSTSSSRGQSLFLPISPERSCTDAGIPDNFCACAIPQKLDVKDPRLIEAALTALSSLNKQLPSNECAPLSLSSVHAGGIVQSGSSNETLIVAFYTHPGGFLFEANVQRNKNGKLKTLGEMLRMNKINTDVSCVSGDLEKLCYCDPS